jgi:hypothetical protein
VRKPTYRSKLSRVIRRPKQWPEFEGPPRSFWADLWRDIALVIERPLLPAAMKNQIASALYPFSVGHEPQTYLVAWMDADARRGLDERTLHELRERLAVLLGQLQNAEAAALEVESLLASNSTWPTPSSPAPDFLSADLAALRAFVARTEKAIAQHDEIYRRGRGGVRDERDDRLDQDVCEIFEEAGLPISTTTDGKFERVLYIFVRAADVLAGRREHGEPNRRRTIRAAAARK